MPGKEVESGKDKSSAESLFSSADMPSTSQVSSNEDAVTMSLFSLQNVKDGVCSYNTMLFSQIHNIYTTAVKLSQAAAAKGAQPPVFTVSILLVPDWKAPDNSYDNPQYQDTKALFFKEVKERFASTQRELAKLGITLVTQDFYEEGNLSEDEKQFLQNLSANGSNADTIKTKALLNNAGRKHLQLDSNTIIKDYQSLYDTTFGLPDSEQRDAFNANQYAPNHISANNKIVYIAPDSPMLARLNSSYYQFMHENAQNMAEKVPGTNAVYDHVFAPTLCEFDLTYKNMEVAKRKIYYPAVITKPEFRITKDVVTAINMSWAEPPKELALDVTILKASEPFEHMDAKYDYPAFNSIVKKYTGFLTKSVRDTEDPNFYFENFLKLSDNQTDLYVWQQYYQAMFANDSEKLKKALAKVLKSPELEAALANPDTILNLQKALAKAIPDTPKGNIITVNLFGRTVQQLHNNPSDFVRDKQYNLQIDIIAPLVQIDKDVSKYLLKREAGFLGQKILERVNNNFAQEVKAIGISGYVRVVDFAVSLEGLENFDTALSKLNKLPQHIQHHLISEAKWILSNANDIQGHFNYIPNRAEMLQHIIDWEHAASSRPAAITPARLKSKDSTDHKKPTSAKPLADIANTNIKPKNN